MLIQGGGPPIADILGSLLSGAGNYIAGAQQAKQRNAELERQKAIDAQNATSAGLANALTRSQLTSNGVDEQGRPIGDPYTQQRQAQPAVPDEMGGIPERPAAATHRIFLTTSRP